MILYVSNDPSDLVEVYCDASAQAAVGNWARRRGLSRVTGKKVARRVLAEIERAGMSQYRFGELLAEALTEARGFPTAVSRTQLSRIITGQYTPTLQELRCYASVLCVTPDQLVGSAGSPDGVGVHLVTYFNRRYVVVSPNRTSAGARALLYELKHRDPSELIGADDPAVETLTGGGHVLDISAHIEEAWRWLTT